VSVRKSVIAALYEFEQMQSIPPSPPKCEVCERPKCEVCERYIDEFHERVSLYQYDGIVVAHDIALRHRDALLAALTAENAKLREVMGAQVKVHAHRRYHRSSHPTCGVCITDDEARALLTEEGKP